MSKKILEFLCESGRRAFDIFFSLILIVLFLPLMVLVVVAIKLDSLGPILYVPERVGTNGIDIRIWKFRTMRHNPHAPLSCRLKHTCDMHVKSEETRVGAFLRRFRIDELPQLFDVLQGTISIVGVRAIDRALFEDLQKWIPDLDHRHKRKLGITGWSQINGWNDRGGTLEEQIAGAKRRHAGDLFYLKRQSFLFDLWIIVLTPLPMRPRTRLLARGRAASRKQFFRTAKFQLPDRL